MASKDKSRKSRRVSKGIRRHRTKAKGFQFGRWCNGLSREERLLARAIFRCGRR